ncbi:MAG: hypothetical protein HETSPECPRED_002580 [Heterodermia speciosa]|uniref:L-tryptophan decarboxylase PsiD-like domain-containing protein n=1 Tax=Heterodermia speciosa TaxID=116794 RepID=A0A8H3EYA7_9LECA|nr:MAG: hypothetical protein HETSPECPRED_002580 [Heterodermia speciosa]
MGNIIGAVRGQNGGRAYSCSQKVLHSDTTEGANKSEMHCPTYSNPIESKHEGEDKAEGQAVHRRCRAPIGSKLLPVIQELQIIIETDPQLFMLFHTMFEEVPKPQPASGILPVSLPGLQSYQDMLEALNVIIQQAPAYTTTLWAGFPINYEFREVMCTESGREAFLNEKVNAQFKKILNEWSAFLDSTDSVAVLSDDSSEGWFGAAAMRDMPTFVDDFECDPSRPHHGFSSWGHFFTRELRAGARPIADPEDNKVVVSPCEASPYRIASGIKSVDRFWVKGQPYSLDHMLAQDPLAAQFYGGSIYQAFLSAQSYHRWHSPVAGRIVKAYVQPGSYYSTAPSASDDKAPAEDSQAYLTAVATRAMIFIEAAHPGIGLICFLPVGMAECSSCLITVTEGQQVEKGQELGMFRYGGSTFCLIFGPRTTLRFDLHGNETSLNGPNTLVNARIATLSS